MTMPDKIWAWEIDNEDIPPNGFYAIAEVDDAVAYTRAPATLEEALRDPGMMGRFVAKEAPYIYTPEQLAGFVGDWVRGQHTPEFVAFVKEEMGK